MGKMKDLSIRQQNAVKEGVAKLEEKGPDEPIVRLREVLAEAYQQGSSDTAELIEKPAKRNATVRTEIVTGIALILIAALFPVEDQNKIVFGFAIGIMYVSLVREFIGLLARIRDRFASTELKRQ
jgi:hypothetical protein